MKLIQRKACRDEMHVVHDGVLHIRRGQCIRKLRLPYTFGEPRSGRGRTKVADEVFAHARDLFGLILGRYGSENRFVKTTANQLDLAEAGELTQAIEEFRMALLEPFEERARVVQTEANGGMASDALNEREIGALVGLFKHAIEITDGLMTMDQKNEMEFGQ